jgi:uncharacterized membrane protein YkvA (DUF1232 family)
LVARADVVDFLRQHADQIAAPDVTTLVASRDALRARMAALAGDHFEQFRAQVHEALVCLEDYVAGRCPQIPYHTIAALTAALFYVENPLDVVPDCVPRLGGVDDAIVMAVATDLAADGLRRYRTWKSTTSA